MIYKDVRYFIQHAVFSRFFESVQVIEGVRLEPSERAEFEYGKG